MKEILYYNLPKVFRKILLLAATEDVEIVLLWYDYALRDFPILNTFSFPEKFTLE